MNFAKYTCENQMSFADLLSPDIWSGKTSPEPSAVTEEKTSEPFSKKPRGLQIKTPLFLDLRGGRSGLLPGAYWEMGGPLLGVYTMHSFGECPREERESRLSQILEDSAHPKYYLSTKACQGILNRAKRRGKTLPEALRIALEKQSAFKSELDALNTIDRPAIAYSQDAYDKYTESNQSATIKQSGGVYGGGSESIVIQSERSADATTKE